jgi:hypothetical protein
MIHFILGRRTIKIKVQTRPQGSTYLQVAVHREVRIYRSLIPLLQITLSTINYNNALIVVLVFQHSALRALRNSRRITN